MCSSVCSPDIHHLPCDLSLGVGDGVGDFKNVKLNEISGSHGGDHPYDESGEYL
jgi:hypothetical protein